MAEQTRIISLALPNQKSVRVEAVVLDPEQRISGKEKAFQEVLEVLEGVSASRLLASWKGSSRPRLTVEFGLRVGLETGGLTALIVKGTGNANMKVTLEWGGPTKTP